MAKDAPTSLGNMYASNVRQQTLALPTVAGTSIGAAYESWFEADQEAEWLRNLEASRQKASDDDTEVISRADVAAYQAELDAARRPGYGRPVSRETTGSTPAQTARPDATADQVGAKAGEGSSGGLLRSSAVMAAGTMASRLLGLVRSSLTIAALGSTGGLANTWDVANTLPNIIYLLLAGGVINAVLVPQITRALEHADGGKAYTDRIVTLTLTILAVVTVVFMAAAPLVYRLFDNNHMTADKSHVAWVFSLICLPQIFFYGVYTIFGQILNARGHFGAFMWSPALANIVIIAGLIWFIAAYPHGQEVLTFGDWTMPMMVVLALPATLGIALQAVVLIPVLKKAGYSFTPNFQFRGVGLRSASTMAGWAFAAVIVQQVGLVITTQLLSSQPEDAPGKAAQSQAFLLFTLPHSLITLSLVTALFTRMSVAAGRGETEKVKEDMTTGIRLSGIASVMLTFGCFALVFPLVGTMFEAKESTLWSIGSIAIAMMIGLVPYSLCLIIQRVFYAYNDARTPFRMQVTCTGIAIVLTLPWFNWQQVTHNLFGTSLIDWTGLQGATILGHPGTHWVGVGVGLAQTISNAVQAGMGFVLLKKKIGHVDLSDTVRTYVRLSVAAVLATVAAYVLARGIRSMMALSRLESLLELLVAGSLFLAVYILVAKRLQVQEVTNMLAPITRRLKRA